MESSQILLDFIQLQDIQAQTLLLSMGASWGDHPGHLVVPPSVTDVELYLGQNVSWDPTTKNSKGIFQLILGGFSSIFFPPPKKKVRKFHGWKVYSTLSPSFSHNHGSVEHYPD